MSLLFNNKAYALYVKAISRNFKARVHALGGARKTAQSGPINEEREKLA